MFPISFYEVSITLVPKSDKDSKKKSYRTISLMNIDTKTLNKILGSWIQEYIKGIRHHDQVGFIPGIQGWFNICKSINVIYYIVIWFLSFILSVSIDGEKAFEKIQHSFMIKILNKVGIEKIHINIIKAIWQVHR